MIIILHNFINNYLSQNVDYFKIKNEEFII